MSALRYCLLNAYQRVKKRVNTSIEQWCNDLKQASSKWANYSSWHGSSSERTWKTAM